MATVLVLYNQPCLPRDHPAAESEHSIVQIAGWIGGVLARAGHSVRDLALGSDPSALWSELQGRRPDIVVNLYEGQLDNAESETHVAGLLEWSGIPYTGCRSQALSLARAKDTTKYLWRGAGLPVADFVVADALPAPAWPGEFPVIVKPARMDASVGVDQHSVCLNQEKIDERVGRLLGAYGPPVLIERYIAGREVHVPVIELPQLRVLPPFEIQFGAESPGAWPILTYERKWGPAGVSKAPADLSAALLARLSDLALRAYRLIGCRDYARVDFRIDQQDECYILEVNPNPEISADSGLATPDLPLETFVIRLAEQALRRA